MSPRAALVTGASSGIGLATARLLAERGWRVYAAVRSAEALSRLSSDASGFTPIEMDVTSGGSIGAARERIEAEMDRQGLAALINNAGVALPTPLEMASLAGVREEFETNALGALAVTQAFLPLLRRGEGSVFLLGSPLATQSRELCGGYAASKAALRSIAETLRLELARSRVGVCYVEADKIATPLWTKASSALENLEETDEYAPAVASAKKLLSLAERGEGFAPPELVAEAIWGALSAEVLPSVVLAP